MFFEKWEERKMTKGKRGEKCQTGESLICPRRHGDWRGVEH